MTKRALMIWGGWEGHEPEACTNLFAGELRNAGVDVTVSNSLDSLFDQDIMANADLIVPCVTMADLSREQEQAMLAAVRDGAGLAGWHGGMGDAFRLNCDYQFAVGGQFVQHPAGFVDYEVNITQHDHEITKGLGTFAMHSEQYYLHVDPTNHVLATTTFAGSEDLPWIDGAVIPVTWTRTYGEGKVFYCSLGHELKDFEVPEARTMVTRGLLWAMR